MVKRAEKIKFGANEILGVILCIIVIVTITMMVRAMTVWPGLKNPIDEFSTQCEQIDGYVVQAGHGQYYCIEEPLMVYKKGQKS